MGETNASHPIQQVFWQTTADMAEHAQPGPLPARVDVAVIGGGFTGLSAARTLAKRGVKVAVLEANHMGWGASSRNGGMVLTGQKLSMESISRQYGREIAHRLFQCSLESVDTVERIVTEENIDCGFHRSGHLLTANKSQHFDALAREAEFMEKEFGHKLKLIARADQRAEVGTDLYHGALLDVLSAGLNPAQYVAGLALAARRAGTSLHARTRVDRLERVRDGWRIETERGSLTADRIFAATSAYTGRAIPALQRKIIPIGSYIIATEKLPPSLASELSPHNRMIFDSKHYLHYFRLWEDRLIFGGRAAFFPENSSTIRQSADILRRDMVQIYPQLKDVRVEYVWGGTLDFAFDMMTHVGELDGLFFAAGYAGHGVAMATYLGKSAAEAMLDGSIREHPFAAFKFPGAPLGAYDGRPWFLPLVGAWHALLDLVE